MYSGRGTISRLVSDDGQRVEISSAGETTQSLRFRRPPGSRTPSFEYDGNVSKSSASTKLRVYNFARAAWETVRGP